MIATEEYWRSIQGFGEPDFEKYYENIVNIAPAGSTLLEIGCYYGRSLIHLGLLAKRANNGLKIIGVDLFERDIRQHIRNSGLEEIITFHQASSLQAVHDFKDESLWFIFLDDAHEHDHVAREIDVWMPKLQKNGILAGHDYLMHTVCEPVNAKLANVKYNPEHPNVWWCFKQTPKDSCGIYNQTVIPNDPRRPRIDSDPEPDQVCLP